MVLKVALADLCVFQSTCLCMSCYTQIWMFSVVSNLFLVVCVQRPFWYSKSTHGILFLTIPRVYSVRHSQATIQFYVYF